MRRLFFVPVLLIAAAVQAQTVTHARAAAKPKHFNGRCPAEIKFIGTIQVSRHPVEVEYVWERSDGARSERHRVVIRSAGQNVNEYWTLGDRGQRLRVWEQLHVLAPTNIRSPRVPVRVNCR